MDEQGESEAHPDAAWPAPPRAPLPDWWWQQALGTRRAIAAGVLVVVVLLAFFGLRAVWPGGDGDDAEADGDVAVATPTTLAPERVAIWEAVAECETGGDWYRNDGGEFSGGLQISLTTWQGVGATGAPWQATPEAQMLVAEEILAIQGWQAWPACARQLGYL